MFNLILFFLYFFMVNNPYIGSNKNGDYICNMRFFISPSGNCNDPTKYVSIKNNFIFYLYYNSKNLEYKEEYV